MSSENAGGPTVLTTAEDTTGGVRVHADKTCSIQGYGPTYESLITTEALEIDDSGSVFGLNLAGGFTITLPTHAQVLASNSGSWWAKFIVMTQPTTAYIITEDAGADTNTIIGNLLEAETDTGDDGPSTTGATFINFVASTADVGDYVEIFGNGVKWYVSGAGVADGWATFT